MIEGADRRLAARAGIMLPHELLFELTPICAALLRRRPDGGALALSFMRVDVPWAFR